MKRKVAIIAAWMMVLLAAFYAGDYVVLRYRDARRHDAFGAVTVRSYYAIGEKNQRTEYVFKNEENQTCVHAMFPHFGFSPCWYLARHTEQQVTI